MTEKIPEYLTATIFRSLWTDVNVNQLDCTILIHGRKRTGKSTIALKILELMNLIPMYENNGGKEHFDFDTIVKERVFYRVGEFVKAIGKTKKKGTVLILDEAGVDASNLKWWDKTVKSLRDIMHVDGMRHLILVIVLPQKMHFAKGTRDMINMEIKTRRVDHRKRKSRCVIKHYGLLENQSKDKGIYQRNRSGNRITKYRIGAPSKELIAAYKRIEGPAKEKIITEKINEIMQNDPTKQTKITNQNNINQTIIDKIVKDGKKFLKKKKDSYVVNRGLIQGKFKISGERATVIKSIIEADYLEQMTQNT